MGPLDLNLHCIAQFICSKWFRHVHHLQLVCVCVHVCTGSDAKSCLWNSSCDPSLRRHMWSPAITSAYLVLYAACPMWMIQFSFDEGVLFPTLPTSHLAVKQSVWRQTMSSVTLCPVCDSVTYIDRTSVDLWHSGAEHHVTRANVMTFCMRLSVMARRKSLQF